MGLLFAITENRLLANNTMSSLSTLVTDIVQEKRRIILNTTGLRISKSLFIPFSTMDPSMLASMHDLISGNNRYQTCDGFTAGSVVYEVLLDDAVEVIGVSNILCAVLLMLRDVYGGINQTAESIFDVVLQTTMNKFRVDYAKTLYDCTQYGYST